MALTIGCETFKIIKANGMMEHHLQSNKTKLEQTDKRKKQH